MRPSAPMAVGIDLGTTRSWMASFFPEKLDQPEILFIPQLNSQRKLESLPSLSSVLWAPLEELAKDLPGSYPPWLLGEYALAQSQIHPERAVRSAKSWISQSMLDPRASYLPWQPRRVEEGPKISPVQALNGVLQCLKSSWEEQHAPYQLKDQKLVLTVPASFDDRARKYLLEVSQTIHPSILLLEEPIAVLYCWLASHKPRGEYCLVIDIGGGTTDFSIIHLQKHQDGFELQRVAVGPHLLLGGDNMDLALLYELSKELHWEPANRYSWIAEIKRLKEVLLSEDFPFRLSLTNPNGKSFEVPVDAARLRAHLLKEFFPKVEADAEPLTKASALHELGLHYPRDVAITKHLAAFLKLHRQIPIDWVCCNGSLFQSSIVREVFREQLLHWFSPSLEIVIPDPQAAVVKGAAYFAYQQLNSAPCRIRLHQNIARSYYVLVQNQERLEALCILAQGVPIGNESRVSDLWLQLGQSIRFELVARYQPNRDQPGDRMHYEADKFEWVGRICTKFHKKSEFKKQRVKIELRSRLEANLNVVLMFNEVGDAKSWVLNFEEQVPELEIHREDDARSGEKIRSVMEAAFIEQTIPVKLLWKKLEELLGERAGWTLEQHRAVFDEIEGLAPKRKQSEDAERIYWQLAGFGLRPGFGFVDDETRVKRMSKRFYEGIFFRQIRNDQQFWIAFRRIAPGIPADVQSEIMSRVLSAKYLKKVLAQPECFDFLVVLERSPLPLRIQLGQMLLEQTWVSDSPQLWWQIAQLSARIPSYAGLEAVIPAPEVEVWIEILLRKKIKKIPKIKEAILLMAAKNEVFALNVKSSIRSELKKKLLAAGYTENELRALDEVQELSKRDGLQRVVGAEGLPIGLMI